MYLLLYLAPVAKGRTWGSNERRLESTPPRRRCRLGRHIDDAKSSLSYFPLIVWPEAMTTSTTTLFALLFLLAAGCAGPRGDAHQSDPGSRSEPHRGDPLELDVATPVEADADATPQGCVELSCLGAQVRMGELEAALENLALIPEETRRGGAARYLEGRLLERLERGAEAAEAYGSATSGLPPSISRDAASRQSALLVRSDQCDAAMPLLERQTKAAGGAGRRARALIGRCALESGDLEVALLHLSVAAQKGATAIDPIDVRLDLAEAQARSGDEASATKTLHDLRVSHPEHPRSSEVVERLAKLPNAPELTAGERLRRATRLLDRRQFSEAVAELDAAGRPTRWAQRGRWLHLRGMALYRTRQSYSEAAKVLSQAARHGGPTAVDDAFHAARALSRADQDDEAISAYRALVDEHPSHGRAASAEFLAAWLEIRHGRSSGEKAMEAFIKGPRARRAPDHKRDALWHLGFRAFERGRYGRATTFLHQYTAASKNKGALYRGRGLYWTARSVEAAGRIGTAQSIYTKVIELEPLHYYALLARQRLEALGQSAPPPFKRGAGGGENREPPLEVRLPAEVSFYYQLGLDEDAARALKGHESTVRGQAPRGRELEALLLAYSKIGAARRPYLLTRRERDTLRRRPSPSNLWLWHSAYPRPYEKLVVHLGTKHGVEPAHVWGTMRQESGYAPSVVSRADAIGLLQLLPSSAERVAKRLDIPYTRELLFRPASNIRFGIGEIADCLEDFDGNLPLTIAAYNAGGARVRRWLTETGEVPLDVFVERIPFDETRNYVRRVLSHYARYRYLEDTSVPWPVTLPEMVGPAKAP